MAHDKLPSCCAFRSVQAGQARNDLRNYVHKKAMHKDLSEAEKKKIAELKQDLVSAREVFEAHIHDESLVHK